MDRLLEMLRAKSFRRGTFTLASGRESDFFVDCKPTVLSAEGHHLVGEAMFARLETFGERPAAVAGVVLGGCPLASAVAMTSYRRETPVDAVLVRKAAKDHGTGARIEGGAHLEAGARVVILEDTVTTGGSTLRAAEVLKDAGLDVVGVVAVIDRREGASEAFEAAGLAFEALYGREHFLGGES